MSGNYEVTVTDANGCHNNFSIFVDQPTEVISSINSDLTICIGESTILHTSATGGVPPYTHHWDNGSALQDITVNPVVTSSYIAYAEDINGCISESVEVTVNVNPPLEIDISISDYYACDGDPVVLTSIISGGNGNYTLTLEDGTIIPNTYSYFPTNNVKELIKVTVTDNCGTPTTFDTISVNILPLPEFTLQPNITQGCEPLDVQFMPFSNANNYSYSWNFGDEYNSNNISNKEKPTHTYNDYGIYTVTLIAETDSGCRNTLAVQDLITVYKQPNALFSVDPKVVSIIKPIVYLNNYSDDASSFNWNFGDTDTSSIENPTHSYLGIPGDYTIKLVVNSIHNCTDSISDIIKILDEHAFYSPTAFTPDNDGINDTWKIFGNSIDNNNFELLIFDRWGEIVYTSTNMNDSWDGTIKSGKIGAIGVYTWVVNYKEKSGLEHQSVGTLNLIR